MVSRPRPILESTPAGLYCPAGDFHVDPQKPVSRAVITHAHSDHARPGCAGYLCSHVTRGLLAERIGHRAVIESLAFGETRTIGSAQVSLHPAGHILGSAQVRIEVAGEVWVVSGDFNNTDRDAFGTAEPFVPVSCDTFVTESTFGLPIYRWPAPATVFAEIRAWWEANRAEGITSVLPAYPLGKSQRLLAALIDPPGPIAVLGNALGFLPHYEAAGVRFPSLRALEAVDPCEFKGLGLIVTSSGAQESALLNRFGPLSWAFASGWMMTRGARRNRDFDRGFVLSDHADWDGLVGAVKATGAERIGVVHGSTDAFARWLRENGWDAFTF